MDRSRSFVLGSQNGFSLIQLLFSLTLLAFSVAAIAHWSGLISDASASLNQTQQIDHIMEKVSGVFLTDDIHCRGVLGGTQLSMSVPAGRQLASIDFKNDNQVVISTVMVRGSAIAGTGLTLEDLRVVPVAQVSPSSLVARIEYTFSKNEKFGIGTVRRFTPVFATVVGGLITDCTTAPIPREVVRQRKCEIGSDGTQSYDPVTNSCVDNPNVVRVLSTSGVAACGAGYDVAANPLDPNAGEIACHSPQITMSFPRGYTNGFIDDSDILHAPFEFDYTARSCSFLGMKGEPLGGHGEIRCVRRGL